MGLISGTDVEYGRGNRGEGGSSDSGCAGGIGANNLVLGEIAIVLVVELSNHIEFYCFLSNHLTKILAEIAKVLILGGWWLSRIGIRSSHVF